MFAGCKGAEQNNNQAVIGIYHVVEGETMGTYYRINYSDTLDFKLEFDSILLEINMEVSTYIPASSISKFNTGENGMVLEQGVFLDNYLLSKKIYQKSDGYYDPTIMPLVNYWGFGYSGKNQVMNIDSIQILEITSYVGLDKISETKTETGIELIKSNPKIELDFSSVAKGYAVDIIADFLKSKGIHNYLVDIGGEMSIKGLNPRGNAWSIGINTPKEGGSMTESIDYISLSDHGIATSGNYRNYYEINGRKVSHTINPKSGFPERSNLLSVTIIAPTCAEADAMATACMVMGLEKASKMIGQESSLDACFVYTEEGEFQVKYLNNFEAFRIKR